MHSCVIVVISNKWQVSGFIRASARLQPSMLVILKLRNFYIDRSIMKDVDFLVEEYLIDDLYDLNSVSFLDAYRKVFCKPREYWEKLLCQNNLEDYTLVTDNDLRPIEMLLKFTVKNLKKVVVYEHGISDDLNYLSTCLLNTIRRLRSALTTIFYLLKYRHNISMGVVYIRKERFYRDSRLNCSGDIFLYENKRRSLLLSSKQEKLAVFFSSGAFRYSDSELRRTTLFGFKYAVEHAKSENLSLIIKLKPGEDKMPYTSIMHESEFAYELMDFSDILSKYNPSVIYTAESSTVVGEAIASRLRVIMYSVASSSGLIPNSKGIEWFSAGVGRLSSGGTIVQEQSPITTPEEVLEDIYRLKAARIHLNG